MEPVFHRPGTIVGQPFQYQDGQQNDVTHGALSAVLEPGVEPPKLASVPVEGGPGTCLTGSDRLDPVKLLAERSHDVADWEAKALKVDPALTAHHFSPLEPCLLLPWIVRAVGLLGTALTYFLTAQIIYAGLREPARSLVAAEDPLACDFAFINLFVPGQSASLFQNE
ncbi:hypothetical protein CCM_03087 [Cordyceps militaris CM01]|uniref:Uncharacterized protein n=1 Tax=Cordyceps militaris (strain CM01) TaxID=983644 RepID=G3J8T3_CORMM|nr:uncharacterized protein CCM_03087 [Cordyceps militaris CM01]EGX94816.1 hypothetical protein CCM_03087 [Cordyceps militaris CM01]